MSQADDIAARLDDLPHRARYGLTEEDEAWRLRAAAFAADHVAPQARQADRDGRFDARLVPALGQAGLLGPALPAAVGGGGASWMADCLVAEAIGAVDGSVRGFLAVQGGLVCAALARYASDAQKAAWLPGLLRGERIGCYALTEEGAGSDVGGMATRIREDEDTLVIDGQKVWITNGGVADVALVFGSIDPELKTRGLACAIVPMDAEGVTREAMGGRELGHRASDHACLTFAGVRVPRANRLGGPDEGFRVAMHGLEAGRLNVAAGAVGIQQACLDASVAFARHRRQFGRRIGDFQQVGATLAEMAVDLESTRLLTYHAARLRDGGLDAAGAVSAAKLAATEAAVQSATKALQLHGSRGYTDELPIERHYRDAIALTIYEGASNIQRVILARRLLGRDEGDPT